MKRNNIPLILMLVAGAVTCIRNLTQEISILGQMASLLIVLLIFYFLGCAVKWVLDYFETQNMKKEREEQESREEDSQEKDAEGSGEE